MITYEQWNKAIISYFFEDCEPGEIVFLQTNEDVLSEIAGYANFKVVDADESLREAVRNKVVRDKSVNLCKVDPSTAHLWNDYSEDGPPQVAFLALTVLAASRMDSEGSVGSQNYYVRLNELLFKQSIGGAPQSFNHRQFEGFWKHLRRWAIDQQGVELYLTEGTLNRKYVWYPISQCLITKHDEHNLQVIFQETNLNPGSYLAESQLLNILRSCKSFEKLSVKIKRPILEGKKAEIRLILGQIQLLLENWDGEVTERVSWGIKRQTPNRVGVQMRFNTSGDIDEVRYWFRRKRSSEITLQYNCLGIETLQPLDERWFRPFVMRVNSLSLQVLQDGIKFKSEEIKPLTFRLKSSDIWVFRYDSEPDDGWFSQGNLLLHEEHLIVYRKWLEIDVMSFLQQICDEELIPKPICIADEETGWQYIKIKPIALCDSSLLGLRVTTSNQIRFVGGLPSDKRSNSYFDFHPPVIVVPALIDLPGKSFFINGQAVEIPSDRKIELPDEPNIKEYRFLYLDCQTKLQIISPIRSTDHEKHTLAVSMDSDSTALPTFADCQVAEISDEPGAWLTGARFFGTDSPKVSWKDVEKICKPPPVDPSFKTPANIISSVTQAAIDLRHGNVSVPEWFDEVLEYLDQNPAVQALVEKKLNRYYEMALPYTELRKRIGR